GGQIMRWNGPAGNFTDITGSGIGGDVKDGDVVEAQMVGGTITVKINGTVVRTTTDSTFTNGSPGIGIFSHNPSPASFGFSSFTASNSPISADTTPPNAPSNLAVR